MKKQIEQINRWLDAILDEDGKNLSFGSVRTIKMIRDTLAQVQASAPPQTPIQEAGEKLAELIASSSQVSPSLKWVKHFQPPFKQAEDTGYVLDSDGNIVLEIRGWGHLTNKMDEPEAANVQEQMARDVAAMLNASLSGIVNEEIIQEAIIFGSQLEAGVVVRDDKVSVVQQFFKTREKKEGGKA